MNITANTIRLGSIKETLQYAIDNNPSSVNNIPQKGWVEVVKHTIQSGSIDTLDMIKQLDIDVNVVDMFGYTSLHHACMSGSYEMYKEFENTPNTFDYKMLHAAGVGRNIDIIREIAKKVDINAQDHDGDTIFHSILDSTQRWNGIANDFEVVLQELINLGFDCSIKNSKGYDSHDYFVTMFGEQFIHKYVLICRIKDLLQSEVNRQQKERILSNIDENEVIEKRRRM